MIPKTDDFKEFGYNTAYFHSIFDSYLQPGLGNDPKLSLTFFIFVIQNLIKKKKKSTIKNNSRRSKKSKRKRSKRKRCKTKCRTRNK